MATTTITKTEKLSGKRIRRKEDPRLITGTATYVDDIKMPGMRHACILRSPHAAARIRSINIKPALDHPGVVAVFTGADIDSVGPVPCGASLPGLRVPPHAVLAKDRVYFAGHPVAVVVATDRYIAADAVDLVEVDYEPGRAVADPEKALEPGAPAVHPEWPDNIAFTYHQEGGEPEKAFAQAEVVVKQRITSQRLIPVAMETRGAVADYRAQQLTLWSSTQIPHLLRTLMAMVLGISEHQFRVIAPEVGGGFGIKRMMDLLADELKIDPAELRLKNFVGPDEFPYQTATGLSYDSGNYAAPLKKALDTVEYVKLREEQKKARAAGRLVGIGMSTY